MKELEEAAKGLGDNMPKIPSIKIGGDDIDDPLVQKMRKWLLISLASLVAGGAIILIIVSIIGKML